MESAENNNTATQQPGGGFTSNGGESKMDNNNNSNSMMDWEMANADDANEEMDNAAPSCTSSAKIVSNVPAEQGEDGIELGARDEDLDVESFSFGSDSGEDTKEDDDASRTPELANPFDIKLLQTVVEASAHALDIVTGKDVVMVAGKTGVGKSTLLQGIAGKRIHEIEHTTSFSGEVATQSAYDAEDALPAFEIGHLKKSKTNAINALVCGEGENSVVYLDTPGFEDTSGMEMDIATAALLSQVAKRCKSLKFIIIIHCASLAEDRGGAFRSVLKFARAFVQDFSASKRSFMFLFSHTDMISGKSKSSTDTRTCLQDEILRIEEGTKDQDVLVVLNYIRRSLNKNYPFAQLYHPMDMDYAKLTGQVEANLTQVTDLTLAKSANITGPSKWKLTSAVQGLVQRLRVALREHTPDIAQVVEIRNMLQVLNEYIDVDCLGQALRETDSVIEEHVVLLRSSISNLVSRGMSSDLEFNSVNIIDLKQDLTQLCDLEGPGASSRCIENIERHLLEFSDGIVERACSATPFHMELRKVIVWAEGFDEFAPVYAQTSSRIVQFASDLSNALEADGTKLSNISDEDLEVYIRNLTSLHAICEQATQFPTFCTAEMMEVIASKDCTLEKVESDLKAWSAATAELANDYDVIDEEGRVEFLARGAHTVQIVRSTLESLIDHSPFHLHRLKDLVVTTSNDIEAKVTEKFSRYYTEMSQSKFDPCWKPMLFWMLSVCNCFVEMEGASWGRMKPSLLSIIDRIKTDLYRASSEIEIMCSLIRDHSSVINGETLALDLISLHEYKWFDDLLPLDQQFVTKCCNSVILVMNERIELKKAELTLLTDSDRPVNVSSVQVILSIGDIRPQLNELERFASTINRYGAYDEMSCSLSSTCEKFLECYVSKLDTLAMKHAARWATQNASGRIDCMLAITRKLDDVLANVDALLNIGGSNSVKLRSIEIQSKLHAEFSKFNTSFRTEFSSFDCSFSTKTGFLTTIQACTGFKHVECLVIDYKEAKQILLELVLKEAAKIEASIEASSQWDEIDGLLLKFEASAVMDDFVEGEISFRLRTIRRLREQKESQVDDQMSAMIQNLDFIGIGEFISPLAQSNDQLKKQKFRSHVEKISSILKEMTLEVNRLLKTDATIEANSHLISVKMNMLVTAESELQSHLASSLNLSYEVCEIKRRMDGILCQITFKISKAIHEKDFIEMVVSKRQGIKFIANMKQHLHASDIRDFECAKDRIEMEMEEATVLKYVENFFEHDFEVGDSLFKSMSSLKHAKDMGNKYPRLVRLYDAAKSSIESNVRARALAVYENVIATKCFDDGITHLHSLYRHLETELSDHCSGELVSHVDQKMGELRRLKRSNDRYLELNGKEYKENLEELASQLNGTISFSIIRRVKESLFGKDKRKSETYSRLCKDLSEKIEHRFDQALAALSARDTLSIQGHIEFLELVQKMAGEHVKIVESRIEVIRKHCIDAFCNVCTEAIKMLSSDNCMTFKELFPDYRGYVVHVTCVLQSPSGQKCFTHVNQLLSKSLESALSELRLCVDADILDSACIRSKVMHSRAWGSFAADHLTLLHEELYMNDAAKQDMWLGRIHNFCWDHFNVGRDLGKLKYCAILGVVPSASEAEIKRAYRDKAKRIHPDKNKSKDANEEFRVIKEAEENLLTMSHITSPTNTQPFDELIRGLGQSLYIRAKSFMNDRRYDMMEKLLFELRNMNILDDLVVPSLQTDVISASVTELVKGLVVQSRVEVESHWSERNYKDLNDVITSLKSMERHFKSYPEIFPRSWDDGIGVKIKGEIDLLGEKARDCLQNRSKANEKQDDFRRYFIQMGFVLTEMPSFKSHTKSVMSCVLESCLNTSWGYGYLFEFGLALQKGDDASTDDENRVAQMIVNEFSHFKEVLVMVWNEEVLQKPADEVVMNIKGDVYVTPTQTCPLPVDHNRLLGSFMTYEREYKSLVADYIKKDSDYRILVHKTLALARKVAPQKKSLCWGDDLKKTIPLLLAGVFSLLTVLKSRESYNRIEESTVVPGMGEKLLMKPHNIQVLSLLLMLGCGTDNNNSIENQLMQIRTGEGKSMILGAASVMFALLGFRVRTVCYSEFLSERDFELFEDVFKRFGLIDFIKYSKITRLAEDTTAAKGNIRGLTETLLRGELSPLAAIANQPQATLSSKHFAHASALERDEILLVDEVDVFFGSEFYGQTYNQVLVLKEPEIEEILRRIWNTWSQIGRRPSLSDIKSMPEYQRLFRKLPSFSFLLDNEILLMIHQVSKVDEVPYHLDLDNDRIGYKVLDSISYDVTYGYCTCFAYLKELPKLKNKAILSEVLVMHVSCGQFSYANISPYRILGVSGTLQALSGHERKILLEYGLDKYIYVPSVYGASNFRFDQAGEGIYIEKTLSDFYHTITAQITSAAKAKRAVIVFFQDRNKLDDFVASPNYLQLNRHRKLLLEDMTSSEKSFVISKAATAGQITLSTAVFGRGTDFFGKDEVVEKNGGVHIIQTFLSEELSEEIQIQGRTARQGKQGSYQMILLETDLQSQFGVDKGDIEKIPQKDLYEWICNLRRLKHSQRCAQMEENLQDATLKDSATHRYFDSLLAGNIADAKAEFEGLYRSMKTAPMPSSLSIDLAFAIDLTGSMVPYSSSIISTIGSLIAGPHSILENLKSTLPDIKFHLRVGCFGFRDIDDKPYQFQDIVWTEGHFTDDVPSALEGISCLCGNSNGGADVAEDHIGVIHHCATNWNHSNDWTSEIKCMFLFSDAPTHGLARPVFSGDNSYDSYPTCHPDGLKLDDAVSSLLAKDISLFFCSFDPYATATTEEEISRCLREHPENKSGGDVVLIPMVPKQQNYKGRARHNIFVLDESGSMTNEWSGVIEAYVKYIEKRKQSQSCNDLVSVVQFDDSAHISVSKVALSKAPHQLAFRGGNTCFHPAASAACQLAHDTPESHTPVIIFMSDGGANTADDANAAVREFSVLNQSFSSTKGYDLELHVIAFGNGACIEQLELIAETSSIGEVHESADLAELASVFASIATSTNVATVLESEIAKRISEAVSDKLSLEYFGS